MSVRIPNLADIVVCGQDCYLPSTVVWSAELLQVLPDSVYALSLSSHLVFSLPVCVSFSQASQSAHTEQSFAYTPALPTTGLGFKEQSLASSLVTQWPFFVHTRSNCW